MNRNANLKLEFSNKLIFVKAYEEAKDLLVELVSTDQGKDELLVHLRLSELAVRLDSVDEFLLFYDEMYASDIFSEKVYSFARGFLKQHSEMFTNQESIDYFLKALDKYPNEPAAYFSIGFGLEGLGSWDRAISNYEKAIAVDQEWYPCYFGLSQIYYNLNMDQKGDHFFYMYENEAPYNLYGNFDTHRKLSNEFLEKEEFEYAELSITTLSEWWEDNKGICPREIKVFEHFSCARIASFKGDALKSESQRKQALSVVTEVLRLPKFDSSALYFIAKVLEEHTEFDVAIKVYKKILKNGDVDPTIIQKIGSQFLSLGQNEIAYSLFDEAYKENPVNKELAFGRLVARLRQKGVEVESYLAQREKMLALASASADKVEMFSLLHNLLAQFEEDAEVHFQMASLYKDMENLDRAIEHIELMLILDGADPSVCINAASFYLQLGRLEDSHRSINLVRYAHLLDPGQLEEYQYIQATLFMHQGEFETATNFLNKLLENDSWNVSYLVQLIYCKMMKIFEDKGEYDDPAIESLMAGKDFNLDWTKYEQTTFQLENLHEAETVYLRNKLRFLYSRGNENHLLKLVHSAIAWNPIIAGNELIRLLNTNFDSPEVYYALSSLFSEQWQLQVSSMWAEQALMHPDLTNDLKRKIYLKLADNYLWEGANLDKALQYAMFARELGPVADEEANRVIGHAYLKQGKPKEAGVHLEQSDGLNYETSYLKGLLEYRNGAIEKANTIWKPLLTVKSSSIKDHHIKQEMLKYYFDDQPYLKVN